jgi:hypothetical protein
MQQLDDKSWIEKFGVTAPIKNIMNCVDDLEKNYERRLAELNAEYQHDVEEILENYRLEKQQFQLISEQQNEELSQALAQLHKTQQCYQAEIVQHKISKDSLEDARKEIAVLGDALRSEQELIIMTELKIKALNNQIQQRLDMDLQLQQVLEETAKPKAKATGFFKKIFKARKPKVPVEENLQEPVFAEPAINEIEISLEIEEKEIQISCKSQYLI